jgi:acyl-CoA synthetase (AMP-forming)/AMP-acid ligase II
MASAGEFLADRLADYKRPRRIVLWPGALPRTTMGKLDKAALREILAAGDAGDGGDAGADTAATTG